MQIDMGAYLFGVPMFVWYLVTALIVLMFVLGFVVYVVRGLPWKIGLAASRNKILQLTSRSNETFAAITPKYRNGMNIHKNKIWLHNPDSVIRCGRVQIQLAPEHWGATWNMSVLEVIDALQREKVAGLHVRTYDDLLALDKMIARSEKKDKGIDWDSSDEDISRYREMVAGISSIQHLAGLVEDGNPGSDMPDLPHKLTDKERGRLKQLIKKTRGTTLDVRDLKKGDGEILYKAIMYPLRGSTIVVKRCMSFFRNNFEIDAPQQIAAHVDSEVALRKSDENSLMKLIIVGAVGIAIACIAGGLAFMMITGGG